MYQEIRAEPGHLTSWGLLEMTSLVTGTKAQELFNGHCFGAERSETHGVIHLPLNIPLSPWVHLSP
jgi:hypothetical protein